MRRPRPSTKSFQPVGWIFLLLLVLAPCAGLAQSAAPDAPQPHAASKPFPMPEQLPEKPSIAPSFSIPVEPLGFTSPAAFYLGERVSMASLDFLDETHLLFSFRAPGLLHRQIADGEQERQIRAVVLTLPTGAVAAEAVWTVHDRARYLWPKPGGHFLLRDRDALMQGDAALELKPYLRFPGPLLWLESDPNGQYLVTDSREPAESRQGDPKAEPEAGATIESDAPNAAGDPALRIRILRQDSGKVMLTSRTRATVHLPINADGYLESLRGNQNQWAIVLKYFGGGQRVLERVESWCAPLPDFVSQQVVVVTGCNGYGEARLTAITTGGRRLWQNEGSDHAIWPLLGHSEDGRRLLRESLIISHAVSARQPIDSGDIKGQLVMVMNTLDGRSVLETTASPVLDAGGNAALSPSGRRAAVLNGGSIQVFDLPTPADLPVPLQDK